MAAAVVWCWRPAAAQGIAADVPLADGGVERVLFAGPANPRAILVMLPGGDGIVDIGTTAASGRLASNFLVRTLPLWVAQGFAVEILGSPQNQSLLGQRHTPAYAAAIERAVDFARSRANAPVWLVGTSQGSTAAANGAARLGGKVSGVVLSSSVTRPNASGETVFDASRGRECPRRLFEPIPPQGGDPGAEQSDPVPPLRCPIAAWLLRHRAAGCAAHRGMDPLTP